MAMDTPTSPRPLRAGTRSVVTLGNGDGTFQAPGTSIGGPASLLAAGDFNGDGKLDLVGVTPSLTTGTINLFLGNGDGTFQPAAPSTAGSKIQSVGVGDFNGDGKPDIVVSDLGTSATTTPGGGENHTTGGTNPGAPASVNILLGNGDGTFQAPVLNPSGGPVSLAAVGDFNGDGKPDVALLVEAVNIGLGGGLTMMMNTNFGTLGSPHQISLVGLQR